MLKPGTDAMLDTDKQLRFVQHCSDAAFGYAAATTAAYSSLAASALEFWAQQMGFAEAEPRSWYRHPDKPKPLTLPSVAGAFAPWAALLPPVSGRSDAPGASSAGMPMGSSNPYASLLDAWVSAPIALMEFWKIERAPAAWPMAMMMMAAGLPRPVAVPAAEANAAALDAAKLAGEAMQNAYASYRSDGGHAVAHILRFNPAERGPVLALMAFAVPVMWPWLGSASRAIS